MMNRTTTNRAPPTPDDHLEDDIKSAAPFSFAIGWESAIFGRIFFALLTLAVTRDGDSSAIAILLAEYRTILMSKIIEALSH